MRLDLMTSVRCDVACTKTGSHHAQQHQTSHQPIIYLYILVRTRPMLSGDKEITEHILITRHEHNACDRLGSLKRQNTPSHSDEELTTLHVHNALVVTSFVKFFVHITQAPSARSLLHRPSAMHKILKINPYLDPKSNTPTTSTEKQNIRLQLHQHFPPICSPISECSSA